MADVKLYCQSQLRHNCHDHSDDDDEGDDDANSSAISPIIVTIAGSQREASESSASDQLTEKRPAQP